jgi:hypothetical protein
MADGTTDNPTTDVDQEEYGDRLDEPLPAGDPGGAHAKGYSADPRPEVPVPAEGPLPLAPAPETHPAVHQPEREGKVQPTGRREEEYTPNDRLTGSDR